MVGYHAKKRYTTLHLEHYTIGFNDDAVYLPLGYHMMN
jgi:hypothetical protein